MPAAGNWNPDWINPLAQWLFYPSVSDESGTISFGRLHFSTLGNLGNKSAVYRVQFRCGNAETPDINITVNSRIETITMGNLTSNIIISHKNVFDETSFLKILDNNGNGVQGKIIDKISVLFINKNKLAFKRKRFIRS